MTKEIHMNGMEVLEIKNEEIPSMVEEDMLWDWLDGHN